MCKFLIVLMTLFFSWNSWSLDLRLLSHIDAGTDVGNGGDVVICENPDGSKTYEMLDVMEGREVYGLEYDWPEGDDKYDIAQALLNRLQRVNIYRWQRLTEFLNNFKQESKFADYTITPIDDSDHPLVPDNCYIKQIAIQKKPAPGLGKTWYFVDTEYFDELDVQNQAMLILHEIVYREAIQNYQHKNSIAARAVAAQLAADHYRGMADRDLFEQLKFMHYPEYFFNGLRFTLPKRSDHLLEWSQDGSVEALPCFYQSDRMLCQNWTGREWNDVFGFTDEMFREGLQSFWPLKEKQSYLVRFSQTREPINLSQQSQTEEVLFNVGDYKFEVSMAPGAAHFLKKNNKAQPEEVKADLKITDKNGDLLYDLNFFDSLRKTTNVKFFYFGSEVFVGLAGGFLNHEGRRKELCAVEPSQGQKMDHYPTLLHFNGGLQFVRVCEGRSGVLGELEFDPRDKIELSAPAGESAQKLVTIKNIGQGRVKQISWDLRSPFSVIDHAGAPNFLKCGSRRGLKTGESCQLLVKFSPQRTGYYSDNLLISYSDGVKTHSHIVKIKAESANPAHLTISESDPFDFGGVAIGGLQSHIFTVTNTGGVAAREMREVGLTVPFSFTGGGYPGTGGDCGASLASGATCALEIQFIPGSTGLFTSGISVSYNNGATTVTSGRRLQGSGQATAQVVMSQTMSFGTVAVGKLARKKIALNNIGGVTATSLVGGGLFAPFSFTGGSYPGIDGTCGASLAAGARCVLDITYAPRVVSAADSDTLEIVYFDGAGVNQSALDIEGAAVAPASLTISETDPYDFGTVAVGSSASHIFTVTNSGGYQAARIKEFGLSSPFGFVGGSYPGRKGDCGSSLSGGASCTLHIEYSPSIPAINDGSIRFHYYNGVSQEQVFRDFVGVAVSEASLTLSGSHPFNFGTVATGSSISHVFTLTNSGGYMAYGIGEIGLASPFRFLGGVYPGVGGNCSSTLAPSSSCDFVVEFSPIATGAFSGKMVIQYNTGGRTALTTRSLQGVGSSPALITISETDPYDYGSVSIGASQESTFVLTNTGGSSAFSMTGAGLAAPFSFKGGRYPGVGGTCGASLANGSSCTIIVSFSPGITGVTNDTIDIHYSDGSGPQNSSRDITGTGVAGALVVISESDPYHFGLIANGSSHSHTFTITNTGGSSATALAEVGLSAPFYYLGGSYPGVGGTCGKVLSSAANCTIVVAFSPTSIGAFSDTISLNYFDGATSQNATRDLQGTSGAPAVLDISGLDPYDFGVQAQGSRVSRIFTVTNAGAIVATGLTDAGTMNQPFAFVGGTYPGTGGTCGGSLASGSHCTIEIEFTPSLAGFQSDEIEINYNDGAGIKSLTHSIQGTGVVSAMLTISDGPKYDFGSVVIGASRDHTFTISNTGQKPAKGVDGLISSYMSFKGGRYPGVGGTCSRTISSDCTVVVTFKPQFIGEQRGILQIGYYDGSSRQLVTRDMWGEGLPKSPSKDINKDLKFISKVK